MRTQGTRDWLNGKGRDSRESNIGLRHLLQAEGAEAQDSEGSTSPPRGHTKGQKAPKWVLQKAALPMGTPEA